MAAPYGLSENRLRAEAVGAIGIYATEIDCPVVRIRPCDRGGLSSSRKKCTAFLSASVYSSSKEIAKKPAQNMDALQYEKPP